VCAHLHLQADVPGHGGKGGALRCASSAVGRVGMPPSGGSKGGIYTVSFH